MITAAVQKDAFGGPVGKAAATLSGGLYGRPSPRYPRRTNTAHERNLSRLWSYKGIKDATMAMGIVESILAALTGAVQTISCDGDALAGRATVQSILDRSRQTVGEYLDYWLEAVAQHRVRPTTFASYGQIVRNRIVPALGTVPLQQLAPAQVQALYGRLLESGRVDGRGPKPSPRSVRYTHTVLRMALDDAVQLGLVSRNVCDAATPPRAVRPPIKY
jgi:Phage integrase, N-terminal SAM-like domain